MAYRAKDFIEAIPGSGGIISTIAKRVGCKWGTAKKWIVEKPSVQEAYDNERESTLDIAESVILDSIKDKVVQDAKWYMSKKGKDRGYGDRLELDANVNVASTPAAVKALQEAKKKLDE